MSDTIELCTGFHDFGADGSCKHCGYRGRPPRALRVEDDTIRGHVANAMQLLIVEQTSDSHQERQLAIAGARRRIQMALELIDREARLDNHLLQLRSTP